MPASVTLAVATGPDCYPIRRLIREHGEEVAQAWVIAVLNEADMMVGGKNAPNVIAMWARLLLSQWAHRSIESVVLAIRDGMTSGKVYGALTYPQIAEWMQQHEERVMGVVESEAAQHRFTGDNLGADYLDRMERGDEMRQLRGQVAALKRKLSNDGRVENLDR